MSNVNIIYDYAIKDCEIRGEDNEGILWLRF